MGGPPPPPPRMSMGGPPPPPPMMNAMSAPSSGHPLNGSNSSLSKTAVEPSPEDHDKRKLTKLHWKEAFLAPTQAKSAVEESIWTSLNPLEIDKEKLAHLFELKQSEVKTKVSF